MISRMPVVTHIGDAANLAVAHELSDAQQEVVGVHLIGQLGDNEELAALGVLVDSDDRAHRDGTTTGAQGIFDAAAPDDDAPRGEVGSTYALDECLKRLLTTGFRVLEHPLHTRRDLTEVVRGDVGGHAHGDAGAAVDQEVGEAARKYDRLQGAPVVIGCEVDRLFVDVAHHLHGEGCHAALGVALCRGRIVTHRAEVALTLHEWVAQ